MTCEICGRKMPARDTGHRCALCTAKVKACFGCPFITVVSKGTPCNFDQKVALIKVIRGYTNMSLNEAKVHVDTLLAKVGVVHVLPMASEVAAMDVYHQLQGLSVVVKIWPR